MLVTCRCADALVTVKVEKDFQRTIGERIGIDFPDRSLRVFDRFSGELLPAEAGRPTD